MKLIKYILIISMFLFFSLAALVFAKPYFVAYKRGAKIVAISHSWDERITRSPCINGGKLVYFSHIGASGQGVIGIKNNNETKYVIINEGENIYWCGNRLGDSPIILSWSKGEKTKSKLYRYQYFGKGRLEREEIDLPNITNDHLILSDWNEKFLLAEISGYRSEKIISGLFLIKFETSTPLIPRLVKSDQYKAGVLALDGFVYKTKSKVYFYNLYKKNNKVVGDVEGVVRSKYSTNNNKIAWHNRKNGNWWIEAININDNVWKVKGLMPFLVKRGVLRVVRDGENNKIVYSKFNGENYIEIVKGGSINNPVYYKGKVYWEEKTINILFPFQVFIKKLFGVDNKVFYERSIIFSKSVGF